jgi:hypothetical protein
VSLGGTLKGPAVLNAGPEAALEKVLLAQQLLLVVVSCCISYVYRFNPLNPSGLYTYHPL